jgi:HAD superfamily hydrolase (TIGR01484 family)
MPAKWLIFDIDGCLSPEESISWDLDLFSRFARLSRDASGGAGPLPPFTLCTGRPQPYAEVLMKLLDIRAPVICENGAVLYTLHDNYARYGPGVTEEKILALRDLRAYLETQVLPQRPEVVLQFGKEAQISIYSENPQVFASIQEEIERFVARKGAPDLAVNSSHYYLNISLAGVDKGHALRVLLDELNVGRDEIAGVGDTDGDLPLREAVGFFACPANAKPSIKAVADYVSPWPVLAGVLDILERPEVQLASLQAIERGQG